MGAKRGTRKKPFARMRQSYYGMKYRCYNPERPQYRWYGARGITICDEWLNDIEAFVEWGKNNGWKAGLTIERIDVNGNYCPENCTWILKSEQSKNKQKTKRSA